MYEISKVLTFSLLTISLSAQPTGTVSLSTYLGGESNEALSSAIYDDHGNLWACGQLDGPGIPFPPGATPTVPPGNGDLFLMKIGVTEDDFGSQSYELQNTLIMGGSGRDSRCYLFMAPGQRLYLLGATESSDFPKLRNTHPGGEAILLAEIAGPGLSPAEEGESVDVVNAATYGIDEGGTAQAVDLKFHSMPDGSLALFLSGSAGGAEFLNLGPFVRHPLQFQDGFVLRLDDQLVAERGFGFGGSGFDGAGELHLGRGSVCGEIVSPGTAPASEDDLGCVMGLTDSDEVSGFENPAPRQQGGVIATFDPVTMVIRNVRFLDATPGENYIPFLLLGGTPSPLPGVNGAQTAQFPWLTVGIIDNGAQVPVETAIATLSGTIRFRTEGFVVGATIAKDGTVFVSTTQQIHACTIGRRSEFDLECALFHSSDQSLRMANNAPALTVFGGADGGLMTTPNALQSEFGGGTGGEFGVGPTDGFLLRFQRPELLGLANAAFNGEISPGDLVTAFGNGIGPQKSMFASADLTEAGSLPFEVSGLRAVIQRLTGETIEAPVLNASYGQSTFEMPQELRPGDQVSVWLEFGGDRSNSYPLTLAENDVSPFLFNGSEAVVQQADGSVATAANPLTPGAVAIVWFNSGNPKSPGCPEPGAISSPSGDPLLGFANQSSYRWELRAITDNREVLASGDFFYIGNSPGQLCSVGQANLQLTGMEAFAAPHVQSALAESARLQSDEPTRYAEILGRKPFIHLALPEGLFQVELLISDGTAPM